MPRIAIGIEYAGGAYSGWQRQLRSPSVQQSLEAALAGVADSEVQLTCAGRTDAGVHAFGQVAHFDTDAGRPMRGWVLGANSALPPDISVRWAVQVPEHFHARYSAIARTYRYFVLNRSARSALAAGRVWQVHGRLDPAAMRAAAALLVGEHDFSAFRAAECQARSPVRKLQSLDVEAEGEGLWITATANAFLHHMVRNLVGLLVAIGRGESPPERAREQLASRQRALGAATAPAAGLYFWRAHYPDGFGLPEASAMILPW